jgi:serine/threonine protein kinase/tetratricopeptide (TPR) repeat protein
MVTSGVWWPRGGQSSVPEGLCRSSGWTCPRDLYPIDRVTRLVQSAVMPLASGARIGPYEVIEILGAGGMGEVYKARDSRLERTVALKLMRTSMGADENQRKRFLREARAISAFNHPGIAGMHDAGEADDCLFLAMEYVSGHTLEQEIAKGPLAGQTVRNYSIQLATALEHAHARGILHRDIKPANIMVSEDGMLKLLDFGLAQFIVSHEETLTMITRPGSFVGTYQYCAPEILSGRTATVRSDIYSLGVVMYEMVCGRAPFAGLPERALVAAALLGEVPPVRQRNPAVLEAMANLIERAMAPQPRDRFASAAELVAALRTMEDRPNSAAIVLEKASPVIAVLDFENLSGDSGAEWLATGIAETITTDLRKLKKVQVVSRDRVQQQLRRVEDRSDTALIGRQLNARWLVMGNFQRAGNRIRITPKLVEAASGESAVLEKIDGAWDDLFELQDRVVSEILRVLDLEMDSSAKRRISTPEMVRLEAYEHYTHGQKGLLILGKDSVENARRELEQAIDLDSEYAAAYGALGHTYAMRWIHRNDPDDLARAAGCLERALELDPESGTPYGRLAYVYLRQNKIQNALEAGRKGARFDRSDFLCHYFVGLAAWTAGLEISDSYFQEAVQHFLDSVEIEPALSSGWVNLATIAMQTGVYDRAESLCSEVFSLRAAGRAIVELPFGEFIQAEILTRRLDWEKALEWHERGLKYLSHVNSVYQETAVALHCCGKAEIYLRLERTEDALAELHHAWRTMQEFPNTMAHTRVLTRIKAGMTSAYASLGEHVRAEQLLHEASGYLETVLANAGGTIHGVMPDDLCHAVAAAHMRMGDPDGAAAVLTKGVEKGCRDAQWMEEEPQFKTLVESGRLDPLLKRIRLFAPLQFRTDRTNK